MGDEIEMLDFFWKLKGFDGQKERIGKEEGQIIRDEKKNF